MASSPTEIQTRFRDAFTHEHLEMLARCVWAAYQEADSICRAHLLDAQAHDVRGHWRRAVIERNWKNYARRIPGATVRQESNSIGSSKHVVIERNGVTLTQSLAASPEDIIQGAHFRSTYVESSQLNLFPEEVTTTADARLYAMFLHGATGSPRQPRFMAVVFPVRNCEAYLAGATIDVMAEFDGLAGQIRTDQAEAIGDDLILELRRLDDSASETA